jgi:5-methylcytosine-specific restriction endonuclease McrA
MLKLEYLYFINILCIPFLEKKMRQDIIDRKQEILDWINENKSKAFMCKSLQCKPDTLESYLKKFKITYKGNQGSRGAKTSKNYVPAIEYVKNTYVSAHKLRLKLIRDEIKKHECEICGITEWMGKEVPLELDHIDGNHYNNDFSNLRIICPNCHSQTDTNSGKKNKKPE